MLWMYAVHPRQIHAVQRSNATYLLGCGIGGNKTMIAHIDVVLEAILQEQALVFKALSDPTRLKIITLLIEANGTLDVNGLGDRLDRLKQPPISHHLHTLIESAPIQSHMQRWVIFYRDMDALL